MYQLFQNPPPSTRGMLTFPYFNYVRGEMQENLEKVIGYYRVSPLYIPSNHILVQILQHINVSLHQDPLLFRDQVSDRLDQVARALRLTTPSNIGRVLDGDFYGSNSTEVMIVHEDRFNLQEARVRWQDLEPLTFLRHPKTDLNMDLPLGHATGSEDDICVLALNLPMLAIQYREWRLRQIEFNGEHQRTTAQFIATYVLPNSLRSQIDIAYINRFVKLFFEEPVSNNRDGHPFYLNNYADRIDQQVEKIVSVIRRRQAELGPLLESLVAIRQESWREALQLPNLPATRQIVWALLLARLPIMTFLVEYDQITGNSRNRTILNQIQRELLSIRNDKVTTQGLPKPVQDVLQDEVEKLEAYFL